MEDRNRAKLMLFSPEEDEQKIISAIADSFGVSMDYINGNNIDLENDMMEIKIEVLTCDMGDDECDIIEEEFRKKAGFFESIQTLNNDIKVNLVNYFFRTQSIAFAHVFPKDENRRADVYKITQHLLLTALKKIEGVMVVNDNGLVISPEGKLIMDKHGNTRVPKYFPFKYQENPRFLKGCSRNQVERRNRSMQELFQKSIYCIELPVNPDDSEVTLRTPEEVAKRAVGLLAVSVFSELLIKNHKTPDQARAYIQELIQHFGIYNIEDIVTPSELGYYYSTTPTQAAQLNYIWAYGDLWCMEWALGLTEWTEPNRMCNVQQAVKNMTQFNSINDIVRKTRMRSKQEILDKADIIYRMDWVAVNAYIKGMKPPALINPTIVKDRHRALNWLWRFGNSDWDNVDTSSKL